MPRVSRRARQDARRALDRRAVHLHALADAAAVPHGGWVRAVRQALGMSAADLGRRVGVSENSVHSLERNEVARSVRLDTLTRAADAMDCVLVYALVPRRSLEDVVVERARDVAAHQMHRVGHTMSLEEQAVSDEVMREQWLDLSRELVDRPGLWAVDADV